MTPTATSAALDPSLLLASGVSGNLGGPTQVADDSQAKRANVNKSPLAVALTPGAAGIFPRGDPWAAAAAQLPAVAACIPFTAAPSAPLVAPPGGAFPEGPSPDRLFREKFNQKLNHNLSDHTQQINNNIDGMRGEINTIGKRLDAHDQRLTDHSAHLQRHDEHNVSQDTKVEDLIMRTAKLRA